MCPTWRREAIEMPARTVLTQKQSKRWLNRNHLSSERAKIRVRREKRPTNILIEYLDVPAHVFRKGDVQINKLGYTFSE